MSDKLDTDRQLLVTPDASDSVEGNEWSETKLQME